MFLTSQIKIASYFLLWWERDGKSEGHRHGMCVRAACVNLLLLPSLSWKRSQEKRFLLFFFIIELIYIQPKSK